MAITFRRRQRSQEQKQAARKEGLHEGIEFEYHDILKEVTDNLSYAEKHGIPFYETVLEQVIKEALEANGVPLEPGDHVVIPVGAWLNREIVEKGEKWNDVVDTVGFEVFAADGNTVKYRGVVSVFLECPKDYEYEKEPVCIIMWIDGIVKKA